MMFEVLTDQLTICQVLGLRDGKGILDHSQLVLLHPHNVQLKDHVLRYIQINHLRTVEQHFKPTFEQLSRSEPCGLAVWVEEGSFHGHT